ncbi:MAG: hypothetical protein ACJ8J0_25680 [Longimicrobiaceae bacterium]
MDFAVDSGGGISGVEWVVLLALLAVVAVVAWQLYRRYTGRAVSDVNGLHFTQRPHTPPE